MRVGRTHGTHLMAECNGVVQNLQSRRDMDGACAGIDRGSASVGRIGKAVIDKSDCRINEALIDFHGADLNLACLTGEGEQKMTASEMVCDAPKPMRTAREDLAAALRWTARLNMHEGIANHYSLAVTPDGQRFLMNPFGRHWSRMRASDLVELDAGARPDSLGDRVDPTAWAIHGALHRTVPQARCVMHLHPRYATVLACLADPTLPPIDQNTMRFFNRVAVDAGFDGMGLGEEAERIATCLGNRSVLLMGQHGVLVAGPSVAWCFDTIYYFERAAETYILALSTGRPLAIASDDVAEKTARQWEDYPGFSEKHLAAIRAVLDDEDVDYRH